MRQSTSILRRALSLVGKAKPTLKGRKVGALVTDGVDRRPAWMGFAPRLKRRARNSSIVAPKIGGVASKGGKHLEADMALSGAPSVLFDAVARPRLPSRASSPLLKNAARSTGYATLSRI